MTKKETRRYLSPEKAIRAELQLPTIGRTKATPAPLAVSPHRLVNQHGAIGIESKNGHLVATMSHHGPKGLATAHAMIKAYNEHPILIKALRQLAIKHHVRMTSGGRFIPNGKSCELCNSNWPDFHNEKHEYDCILKG